MAADRSGERSRRGRTDSSIRTIAFFGMFGVGNIGNEASLSSAVAAAQQFSPTAELICVCTGPSVVEQRHGLTAVPIQLAWPLPDSPSGPRLIRLAQWPLFEIARWISGYRFLRDVDLMIVPGTGALDDFGYRPRDMPYQLFRWSLTARLARKPFAFLSVGAGPIRHPVSRFLMKCAVKFSSYCSYRDEGSRSFMAEIGASTMDRPVAPDIVFYLPRPGEHGLRSARSTIGLGVMSYHGWVNDPANGAEIFQRYIDNLTTVVCHILDRGFAIRILTGEKGDEHAVHALIAAIRQRRSGDHHAGELIFEPIDSMNELLMQIAATDAVIATRYHNVVGALMMNRPVVSIGYSTKFLDLMRGFGLGHYCHEVETFSADAVLTDLVELLGEWDARSPGIDSGNRERIDVLAHQFEVLIGDGSNPGIVAAL